MLAQEKIAIGFVALSYGRKRRCYTRNKNSGGSALATGNHGNNSIRTAQNRAGSRSTARVAPITFRLAQSPLRRRRIRRNRCDGLPVNWRWRAWIANWRRRRTRRHGGRRTAKPIATTTASTAQCESKNRHEKRRPLHICVSVPEEHPLSQLRRASARSSMLPMPIRAWQKLANQPYPAHSDVQIQPLRNRNICCARGPLVTHVPIATTSKDKTAHQNETNRQ